MAVRPLIVANWKMELGLGESRQACRALGKQLEPFTRRADIVICPSFPALRDCGEELSGSGLRLGAQDLFWEPRGPFTGEVSGRSLVELGCTHVIVGHSERRRLGEDNVLVAKKLRAALASGLTPILCVGERREERSAGRAETTVLWQLAEARETPGLVIAYEPVWAIGSGTPSTPRDAQNMAEVIQRAVPKLAAVLYGGSVDEGNVKGFVDGERIQGVLVGGASLEPKQFTAIVRTICSAI